MSKRNTRKLRRKMLQAYIRDFGNTSFFATPSLIAMQKRHNAIIRREIKKG